MPHKGLGQLRWLTRGERFLIDRHRRGENQAATAARYNVSRFVYGQWERDIVEGPEIRMLYLTGSLQGHERCLLYRRRAKVTQGQVARKLKRCRWWVNMMERGVINCDELLWFWES